MSLNNIDLYTGGKRQLQDASPDSMLFCNLKKSSNTNLMIIINYAYSKLIKIKKKKNFHYEKLEMQKLLPNLLYLFLDDQLYFLQKNDLVCFLKCMRQNSLISNTHETKFPYKQFRMITSD